MKKRSHHNNPRHTTASERAETLCQQLFSHEDSKLWGRERLIIQRGLAAHAAEALARERRRTRQGGR